MLLLLSDTNATKPEGAIQSRRARPRAGWRTHFCLSQKQKQATAGTPPPVRGPATHAGCSGKQRSERNRPPPPPVQPFTRIMQHPHHDWPRVFDGRERAGLSVSSGMPWQQPVRFWNSKRAARERPSSTTSTQGKVALKFVPISSHTKSGQLLAMIHPQPPCPCRRRQTAMHVASCKAWVGNRPSCLIARRQTSASAFLLFLVAVCTRQTLPGSLGDFGRLVGQTPSGHPTLRLTVCRC